MSFLFSFIVLTIYSSSLYASNLNNFEGIYELESLEKSDSLCPNQISIKKNKSTSLEIFDSKNKFWFGLNHIDEKTKKNTDYSCDFVNPLKTVTKSNVRTRSSNQIIKKKKSIQKVAGSLFTAATTETTSISLKMLDSQTIEILKKSSVGQLLRKQKESISCQYHRLK